MATGANILKTGGLLTPEGVKRQARAAFRDAYILKLSAAMNAHPEEYAYPADDVPAVVDRMIAAIARGGFTVGPALKATAKAVGIKPTMAAIRAYIIESEAS